MRSLQRSTRRKKSPREEWDASAGRCFFSSPPASPALMDVARCPFCNRALIKRIDRRGPYWQCNCPRRHNENRNSTPNVNPPRR